MVYNPFPHPHKRTQWLRMYDGDGPCESHELVLGISFASELCRKCTQNQDYRLCKFYSAISLVTNMSYRWPKCSIIICFICGSPLNLNYPAFLHSVLMCWSIKLIVKSGSHLLGLGHMGTLKEPGNYGIITPTCYAAETKLIQL